MKNTPYEKYDISGIYIEFGCIPWNHKWIMNWKVTDAHDMSYDRCFWRHKAYLWRHLWLAAVKKVTSLTSWQIWNSQNYNQQTEIILVFCLWSIDWWFKS